MDIIERKSDFSREEKILLFDDLRKRYTDLVKSLKDCDSKSSPNFHEKKESNKKFKNDDIDLLLQESDDEKESVAHDVKQENKDGQWEVDASFPNGWLCKNTPFGKRYKNPQGRGFTSKYEAIRHTRENNLATSVEIEKMIDSLNGYAGWETNDSLPKFWFVRRPNNTKARLYEYLTDTQVILPNMEKVVEHMKENKYSEAEIDRFKEVNGLNWKTHPDLPAGFRYGEYGAKTGNFATDRKIKTFMDPSGKRYPGIAHLVRFFIKRGDGVEPLKNFLTTEGWFETDLLPSGCFMRQKISEKGFTYLTPEGQKFNATIHMINYLRKEHKWEEKFITKFINEHKSLATKTINPRSRNRSIKTEKMDQEYSISESRIDDNDNIDNTSDCNEDENGLMWKPDIFLPEGWQVAVSKIGDGSEVRRYMSPQGDLLGTLPLALKHISKLGEVTEDQMNILKDGLEYEGWSKELSLPEGWLVKTERGKERFLSPQLDQYNCKKDVLKYLKEKNVQEPKEGKLLEEADPIKKNDWKDAPYLPAGWKTCVAEAGKPGSRFKYHKYKSPSDREFQGLAKAMREMIAENYHEEDIQKMRRGFFLQGWRECKRKNII